MAKITKKKLSDSVLDEIRRMILSGEIQEGDKLPNQIAFAEQLGVSRPSLREALQTLQRIGAIEQRPGLGTVLVSRVPVLISDEFKQPFLSDKQATAELNETRRLIEIGMIELAVERATDEEIAQIGEIVDEMVEAVRSDEIGDYQNKDLMFHLLIAKATHNRFIIQLFQNIRQSLDQFLKEAFFVMPERVELSLKDHLAIYEALRTKDAGKAHDAMSEHLLQVQDALEGYYSKSI
ncbi:MAG: FadR family transcriptional regulator [Desulfobacterales bacterium]|nr:FadR family transcriptional regulator [Desulfobacterales bacterium]